MVMKKPVSVAVIVVAGGSGQRAADREHALPKQYRDLSGKPVLAHSLTRFARMQDVDVILPVIGAGQEKWYRRIGFEDRKLLPPVTGGNSRQQSCLFGLEALEKVAPRFVLIHDAARPLVFEDTLERLLAALKHHQGAIPALPVTDTIKKSTDGCHIEETANRNHLWAAQTPQGFHYADILQAHRSAQEQTTPLTDDSAVAEWAGLDVVLVAGDKRTQKITTSADFARLAALLSHEVPMETRIGNGLDIHPFGSGNKVILGGIPIPHDAGLKGHSDADAALHVLTDALLGALAEGDIGTHFPPSEKRWKGEPSTTFLSFATGRVAERGGRIIHLDLTINCEAPKINPHVPEIRKSIADICGIDTSRVSVKATTSEKMGFVGRREGLMTMATATIQLPVSTRDEDLSKKEQPDNV